MGSEEPDLDVGGELLRRCWRRGTLREVVRRGSRLVKQYRIPPGTRPAARPWLNEHRALEVLDGNGFPRSYGFREEVRDGSLLIVFERDYVDGAPLGRVTLDDAERIGRLLAALHRRGIVTDDATIANFVRRPDGTVTFLDFGRARVFARRGLLFLVLVGREWARLRRETFGGCGDLWSAFLRAYAGAIRYSRARWAFVHVAFRCCVWARRIRKEFLAGQLRRFDQSPSR